MDNVKELCDIKLVHKLILGRGSPSPVRVRPWPRASFSIGASVFKYILWVYMLIGLVCNAISPYTTPSPTSENKRIETGGAT